MLYAAPRGARARRVARLPDQPTGPVLSKVTVFGGGVAIPRTVLPTAEVLERISDGIFVLDEDWRFAFVNPGGARLIGRSPDELLGRVIWEEFPEAVGSVFDEQYRRAMRTQHSSEFDAYFEPLGRWYTVRTLPSPDALTVIYHDATQRRAADEAIQALLGQLQRQRRLATVLAETNEVVFRAGSISELFHAATSIAVDHGGFVMSWIGVVDPETGALIDVAHAGYGAEEYLRDASITAFDEPHGRGIGGRAVRLGEDQFSHDILVDADMGPWREAAARLGYRSSGALPLSIDGEVRGLLSVYAREPSYFNDHERTLVHRLAANVAYGWEALQREEDLRESDVARRTAQRFRAVLSGAPDAIIGLDADERIEMANDRVRDLFGWPVNDILGKSVETLITLEGGEGPLDVAGRITQPTRASDTFSGWRRDGSRFPADLALSTVTDEEGRSSTILAVRDLTERLELEERRRALALEAEREQQDRLDSLGRLAGGVAHDFNNLLGVILNFTTLMEGQDLAAQSRHDLSQIRADAERGAALTRQLLTFARRESVRAEPVDVPRAVRAIAVLLERSLGPSVTLDLELSDDVANVLIDPQQFDQVIVNLAINARDAMVNGGHLTVAVGNDGDDEVVVRVSDTGVGMTPDVLARAFEPFFTTKQRGQGTGLGLATVYGVVSRANGRVTIESRPGEGTTFEIRLPAHHAGIPAAEHHEATSPATRAGRLLLVEDDPQLREATRRILRDAGYDVVVAGDGAEALALVDDPTVEVDAVVSDVVMPVLTGDELARELERRTPRLPIILMSGYDSAPPAQHRPVLLKPVDAASLLRAIEEALDGR